MKVSYKTLPSGSFTTLFDEGDGTAAATEFAPSFSPSLQQEQLYQQLAQFRNVIGNIAGTLRVRWNLQYATRAAALTSIYTIASLQNSLMHLKVEEGATTLYFPNAAIQSYEPKLSGLSADHSIQFSTDNISNADPS